MDFRNIFREPSYDFLRTDPRLGPHLCYLTISGSYAYGTNNENSDIDVRGVAVEDRDDLFLGRGLQQIEERTTDTVVYGLRKYVSICRECNPNSVELLGTKPEHILFMNDIGKELRDNAELFLSKMAYRSFAGYATSQLRRIQNAMAHDSYPALEKERHIKKSIDSMMLYVKDQYSLHDGMFSFKVLECEEPQLAISVNVNDMPLRQFSAINCHLHTMLHNYDKLNHRNRKKDDAHLRKHAMHLVRLYLTGIDILKGNGIITYREKELPLLHGIRSGEIPMEDVFVMADEFERQIREAYQKSKLPVEPDDKAIDGLLLKIYRNL